MRKKAQKNKDVLIKKSFRLPSSVLKKLKEWEQSYYRLCPEEKISDSDIIRIALGNFLESVLPSKELFTNDESTVLESKKLDKQTEPELLQMLEALRELVPTFQEYKNIQDSEIILHMNTPAAVKTLLFAMLFGNNKSRLSAADAILDRALGTPIKKQVMISRSNNLERNPDTEEDLSAIMQELPPNFLQEIFKNKNEKKI